MMTLITATITLVAGLYVCYKALLALNKMTSSTRHLVRAAYVCLASAGFAFVVSCFVLRNTFEAVAALGIALFLAGNRRHNEVDNDNQP